MAVVVGVHGIGQQVRGPNTLRAEWLPALRDGLSRVGASLARDEDLECAFYGDLFRPAGTKAVGDQPFIAADIEEPDEHDLLFAWAAEATRIVSPTGGRATKGTPGTVQAALNVLSNSPFFTGVAERLMIADLKQVRAYFRDAHTRKVIRERVSACIGSDTRVVIGHSLGSVVAYEVLCGLPNHRVRAFVTLGSPLGIRNLVFDVLDPAPSNGLGVWPGSAEHWANIADQGDVVALVKRLQTVFGERVHDALVNNGATAHAVSPYLTARETGAAIARGL